jgi:DNA topoisomerase-2
MKGLESDTIALLNKRIYDCIACTNKTVNVFLNGEKIKGKGLQDYAKYFFDEEASLKTFYESCVQRVGGVEYVWEYIVSPWENFEHVSFVNGNSTYQGGKHVDHIVYQITNKIKALLESKKKLKDVKPAMIREKLFLFLRATVVNPQFSSQTKEFLTTQSKDFGCRVDVSDKFIDRLWKSSIVEELVEFCKMKESLDLAKQTDGKKKSKIYVPKLEDASWAGTPKSDQCTLILTEGDSAKTFALWGRSVVGTDKYGVYPLKGKVLNVRDATTQQLINNEEINHIKQIIGLKQGKEYKDTSDLRYGKIMILTDADVDGSHIKGLIMNMFHYWWPSLLKFNYIQTLKTPIVKAMKGKKVLEFFTQQDYENWKDTTNTGGYQIRYYKGLGTSKRDDAKDSFIRLEELRADYFYKDENCDNALLLAFEKDKNVKPKKENSTNENEDCTTVSTATTKFTDKRKAWLSTYDKNVFVDIKKNKISYQEFIHKDLIHFSIYDNTRSIPSLCDGLKPSQRKILYYMLKKNLINKEIKVAQLSGYVSAETSYHHGEASLQQAIIGMAQDFVGSNNVNLLKPDSNFGSRYQGGKDAASPRYIFTRLSQITPSIFRAEDTPLLSFGNDDGQQIEPEWYIPVIPTVIINGCEGIGTGYSTYIPPHNPKDVLENILRVLDDKSPLPMKPFFRWFNGEVVETEPGCFVTKGKWEKISDYKVKVTELPVGTWVTPYKEFLESMIETSTPSKKDQPKKKTTKIVLKDVKNNTTDENTGICFIIEFKNAKDLEQLIKTGTIEKELKLTKSFNMNNMYLFDDNLIPTKYKDTNDILLDFCDIRMEFYHERRKYLIAKLSRELEILRAKVRFINEYIDGTLDINRKTKDYMISLLEERGYKMFGDVEDEQEQEGESNSKSFDYLIRLPLVSLTLEKIKDLEKQTSNKQEELTTLQGKSEKDLWREDLDVIAAQL